MHVLQQQSKLPLTICSSKGSNRCARLPTAFQRQQGHVCSKLYAASADVTYGSPVSQLQIPHVSKSAPKLQSRHMQGSPADGLWASASAALLQLELLAAATVDRHAKFGPALMSALAGATASMGIDGFTLLQYGMPQYLQDVLLVSFGAWDPTLFSIALTAVALPTTAWALRCWWTTNVQLLSGQGGAVQTLQQWLGQDGQQPQQQLEQGSSHWVAGIVAIARAMLLSSAIGSLTTAIASGTLTGRAIAAAAGLAAALAAAAPLVLSLTGSHSSTNNSSSKGTSAAVQVLLVEAAWLLAMVGVAPVINAAAAVGIAAGLLSLHKQVVAPRLAQYQVSAGHEVQAHVSLKLAGTAVAFDSTLAEDPLQLVAAPRSPEQIQAWQQVSSDTFWDNITDQEQAEQQQEGAAAAEAGSSSSNVSELRNLAQGLRGWLSTPAARWEPLLPFVAEAACGMYLGETRTVDVFNPKATGYWNPSYSWWQPTADVAAKFKGQMPSPGDVFWYPVSGTAHVPTRVSAVGEKYVELDANYGVTDTMLQLEVKLVKVMK